MFDRVSNVNLTPSPVYRLMHSDITSQIYNPETVSALRAYEEHLQRVTTVLERREEVARGRLEEYEVVEGGDMRNLAGRYAGLVREVERVEGDVRRLGGEV